MLEGSSDGAFDGRVEGEIDGEADGSWDGFVVGLFDGNSVGRSDGMNDGVLLGNVVGSVVGRMDGRSLGLVVGGSVISKINVLKVCLTGIPTEPRSFVICARLAFMYVSNSFTYSVTLVNFDVNSTEYLTFKYCRGGKNVISAFGSVTLVNTLSSLVPL